MIHLIIKSCLEAIAEKSIGPTYTSRNLFLISSILYNSQTYFDPKFTPFDNYSKSSHIISSSYALYIYTYNAEIALTLLNASGSNFDASSSISTFLTSNSLFTNSKYISFKKINNFKNLFNNIASNISSYLSYRNSDNSSIANTQLSESELPNGSNIIDPTESINFDDYSEPLKWTPINTNFYLTPYWGNVSGFLSEDTLSTYTSFINNFLENIDLEYEAYKVLQTSLSLSDKEKCIAELWAGVSNTVTPPGFWNIFLLSYFLKNSSNNYSSYIKEAKYFLILNSALFQTSIFVWRTKFNNFQARPIQTIRYYYSNETISYYGGNDVSVSLWKPYQLESAITPPFPDFISGHSTFSAVGSRILSKLIGNNLIDLNLSINGSFMKNFSSLFDNNNVEDNVYLHCFTIFPKCSAIDSTVPNKAITLTYNTWDDMALEAGISRIYGGIHYDVSNYAGYLVGNKISNDILSLFGL